MTTPAGISREELGPFRFNEGGTQGLVAQFWDDGTLKRFVNFGQPSRFRAALELDHGVQRGRLMRGGTVDRFEEGRVERRLSGQVDPSFVFEIDFVTWVQESARAIAELGESAVPAFILGFECQRARALRESLVEAPPWLLALDHQAGGYACAKVDLLGCVLRLHDNAARAKREPGDLIRAFDALGESGDLQDLVALDPDVQGLELLSRTGGGSYAADDERLLHETLTRFYVIPKFEKAIEAFVSFESCPLDAFLTWIPLGVDLPTTHGCELSWAARVAYPLPSALTSADLDALASAGRSLGLGPPRLFFAWENSD